VGTTVRVRHVFDGEICGFGTTSGHRFVIGRWDRSPLGSFTDVMHETPEGWRVLRAPSVEVAEFVQATYTFDEVHIAALDSTRDDCGLRVTADGLSMSIDIGSRTPIGWALRSVPRRIARSAAWCSAIDPVARLAMRGVRTKGTAGNERREWYAATDLHRLVSVEATLDGRALGGLADVEPPVRFGFSSTPRRPSIVAVTTTVETS